MKTSIECGDVSFFLSPDQVPGEPKRVRTCFLLRILDEAGVEFARHGWDLSPDPNHPKMQATKPSMASLPPLPTAPIPAMDLIELAGKMGGKILFSFPEESASHHEMQMMISPEITEAAHAVWKDKAQAQAAVDKEVEDKRQAEYAAAAQAAYDAWLDTCPPLGGTCYDFPTGSDAPFAVEAEPTAEELQACIARVAKHWREQLVLTGVIADEKPMTKEVPKYNVASFKIE